MTTKSKGESISHDAIKNYYSNLPKYRDLEEQDEQSK